MTRKAVTTDKTEIEKEVTMVAYATDEHKSDTPEEWLGEVLGVDFSKTKKTSQTDTDVIIEGPEDDYGFRRDYTTSIPDFREVVNEIESEEVELKNGGRIRIEKETKLTEEKVNSVSTQLKNLMSYVMALLPDKIEPDIHRKEKYRRYEIEDVSEFPISITHINIEEMRILSKEQKRKNDKMYETIGERPCISFVIKLKADSKDEMEKFNSKIITGLHKHLSRTPNIGKVRYMSCEVTTKKEGECYNL